MVESKLITDLRIELEATRRERDSYREVALGSSQQFPGGQPGLTYQQMYDSVIQDFQKLSQEKNALVQRVDAMSCERTGLLRQIAELDSALVSADHIVAGPPPTEITADTKELKRRLLEAENRASRLALDGESRTQCIMQEVEKSRRLDMMMRRRDRWKQRADESDKARIAAEDQLAEAKTVIAQLKAQPIIAQAAWERVSNERAALQKRVEMMEMTENSTIKILRTERDESQTASKALAAQVASVERERDNLRKDREDWKNLWHERGEAIDKLRQDFREEVARLTGQVTELIPERDSAQQAVRKYAQRSLEQGEKIAQLKAACVALREECHPSRIKLVGGPEAIASDGPLGSTERFRKIPVPTQRLDVCRSITLYTDDGGQRVIQSAFVALKDEWNEEARHVMELAEKNKSLGHDLAGMQEDRDLFRRRAASAEASVQKISGEMQRWINSAKMLVDYASTVDEPLRDASTESVRDQVKAAKSTLPESSQTEGGE